MNNDNLLGLTGMENTAEAGEKTAAAKKAAAEIYRKFGAARYGDFVKLHFKTAQEAAE